MGPSQLSGGLVRILVNDLYLLRILVPCPLRFRDREYGMVVVLGDVSEGASAGGIEDVRDADGEPSGTSGIGLRVGPNRYLYQAVPVRSLFGVTSRSRGRIGSSPVQLVKGVSFCRLEGSAVSLLERDYLPDVGAPAVYPLTVGR